MTARDSLRAERFAPLKSGFVTHAAPEAIAAEIHRLQAKRQNIHDHIEALLRLRDERQRQIEAGEWPATSSVQRRTGDGPWNDPDNYCPHGHVLPDAEHSSAGLETCDRCGF